MQDLLDVERMLLINFENYAKELQDRLGIIKGALAKYSDFVKEVDDHQELYLANSVSYLKLIRHMSQDWAAWQRVMEAPLAEDQVQMQKRLLGLTPRHLSLQRAVQRLQSVVKFYDLQPASFLKNQQHLRLNPLDCYHMGVALFEQRNYEDAAKWLTVAAENYTSSPLNDLIGIPHWRVYEMQFEALLKIDKKYSAHVAISKALKLAPTNEQLLKQQQRLVTDDRLIDSNSNPSAVLSELQQQCRGKLRQNRTLSCQYNKRNTEFLRLAPLAVEDLWINPHVMLYKQGIYEREIRHIKKAFKSCPESHKFAEEPEISGCLIPSSYSLRIRRISERLQDMTGLDGAMDGFFVLTFNNSDSFQLFQLKILKEIIQDVKATAIVFLNNVAFGGALTIPNIDVVVKPSCGDALITFNEGNFEHTMCPNVVGTSMVIIKLFFEAGVDEMELVDDEE
ncbi:uncharacterized protein LOC117573779 [Drosophila albomicans]|uniref:Uncharacterized protein LOC117573779 n=1 Tax=Drosophila albomicans TaxID=7291 RepID=A0A6P8XP33_DROAB|nr:uncharacterized protein LOC117573779 [Drosophila albomicans]